MKPEPLSDDAIITIGLNAVLVHEGDEGDAADIIYDVAVDAARAALEELGIKTILEDCHFCDEGVCVILDKVCAPSLKPEDDCPLDKGAVLVRMSK